jgi:hypothetical protein
VFGCSLPKSGLPIRSLPAHFLTGLSFHAPNPLRLRPFKLANKTLDRLIGIAEAVLLHQILVNALGTQAHLDLSANHLCQRSQRLLRPAPVPAIEMAGFGSRKYRPTVSRLIPKSFAIRRCDQPRWAKLYIVVCRLTLRTSDMPH